MTEVPGRQPEAASCEPTGSVPPLGLGDLDGEALIFWYNQWAEVKDRLDWLEERCAELTRQLRRYQAAMRASTTLFIAATAEE